LVCAVRIRQDEQPHARSNVVIGRIEEHGLDLFIPVCSLSLSAAERDRTVSEILTDRASEIWLRRASD